MKSHFGYSFNSEEIDPYLYGLVIIILSSLIQDAKISKKHIKVEEYRISETFLYYISVKGLVAYVGRDKETNKIIYLFADHARIKWAMEEGFFDNPLFTRESVFEKIGVMRKLPNINEFVKFLAGKPFEGVGPYIKTIDVANEIEE